MNKKDTSTANCLSLTFTALNISQDPEAMIEYLQATKKERRREETMQSRENMNKFLNNKYNKRRIK